MNSIKEETKEIDIHPYAYYLRETQHKMPDLPRNHSEPKKRKKHRAAVDHRITWKNHEVRVVDVFYQGQHQLHVLIGNVVIRVKLTVKHMRSMPSAVINNVKIRLLKIQSNSKFVRKFRYESSMLFSYSSSGSSNGASARFTVDSNWLSISACGLSSSSMKLVFIPSFCVCAEGSASALSEPLVPQDTSCQLQNA